MYIGRCSSFHYIVACLFEFIWVPKSLMQECYKLFTTPAYQIWWFGIFVAFDVCFIWSWALQVFSPMSFHIYRGAYLVFLWSMWWLAQACKVAFVILLSPCSAVIFMPCKPDATVRSMLILSIFSKGVLKIWLCSIHPCPCLQLWSVLACLILALLLL